MKRESLPLLIAISGAACAPAAPPPASSAPTPPPSSTPAAPPSASAAVTAPAMPEPRALRYELIGAVPEAKDDQLQLFALDHHLVVTMTSSGAKARVRMVIFDGTKLVTPKPIDLPEKVSGVQFMAGDWPARVDVLAIGRKPVGETYLEQVGYRIVDGRWKEQKLGFYLGKIGDRVVTAEHPKGQPTGIRAVTGKPLPRFQLTPRGKGDCPEAGPAVDTALFPRLVLGIGAGGFVTIGNTCDLHVGVEVFPPAGGPGRLHVSPTPAWEQYQVENIHAAVRGDEVWIARSQQVLRFDGKEWQSVPPPGAESSLHAIAVDGERALWLLDHDGLVERKGDAYVHHFGPPGPTHPQAIAVGPDGGLVMLSNEVLFRVRRAPEEQR